LQGAIADLDGASFRVIPDGSEETADAMIFFVKDQTTARRCREALLQAGLGTKILPEAITWHFAGTWDHMPSLVAANGGNLSSAFPKSKALLDRAVALPIMVEMDPNVPRRVFEALKPILS
jgi:8-amino-3,8-dideoxy-alpha-D-manno-octulosonate transaminase